ncbi:hypothetical protein PIROE2DRAFT_1685 [Piromyces sp. E2]|nr:hypothetical protein PIROE2DRAFT_1685 [Piromyces sp. E2]|eukprot:OUM70270.1 hypothetical protein PIROE2DRAFT_1685 [Piromyces sp. E2]
MNSNNNNSYLSVKQKKKLVEGRCVHIDLNDIKNYNYFIFYPVTTFSGNITYSIISKLTLQYIYCVNNGDINVIFYESKYQLKIDMDGFTKNLGYFDNDSYLYLVGPSKNLSKCLP